MPLRQLNQKKAYEEELKKQPYLRPVSRSEIQTGRGTLPWYGERGYCARCTQLYAIPEELRERRVWCPRCHAPLRMTQVERSMTIPKYAKELKVLSPEAEEYGY